MSATGTARHGVLVVAALAAHEAWAWRWRGWALPCKRGSGQDQGTWRNPAGMGTVSLALLAGVGGSHCMSIWTSSEEG